MQHRGEIPRFKESRLLDNHGSDLWRTRHSVRSAICARRGSINQRSGRIMNLLTLFDAQTLLTYCLAAIALVIAPGPGQALVIARTIEGGFRAGLLTNVGLEIGTFVHTIAAAIGLSAILATSATAFAAVKYAGAAYLIALGVMTLRKARSAKTQVDPGTLIAVTRDRMLIVHAAATGVFNPKVAIFFLAFLPQFVHPERGAVFAQFLTLGTILIMFGFTGDAIVAWLTARARARVARSGRFARWRESIIGTVLVALGLRLAFAQRQ